MINASMSAFATHWTASVASARACVSVVDATVNTATWPSVAKMPVPIVKCAQRGTTPLK